MEDVEGVLKAQEISEMKMPDVCFARFNPPGGKTCTKFDPEDWADASDHPISCTT
jgi:hypothetical protein